MFPYDGKTQFQTATDPFILALMAAVSATQDAVLGQVSPDPNLKVLAHFEGPTQAIGTFTSSGSLRAWAGKYGNGLIIEGPTSNIVTNPSAEIDLTSWQAADASVVLTRDATISYTANSTVSAASFKIAGSSLAGQGAVYTTLPVMAGATYSASAFVYAPPGSSIKAQLGVSFSGGSPQTNFSSATSLTPGGWTRLRLENQGSTNNNSVSVVIQVTEQAPAYPSGSRLSTLLPTATASVTDNAMSIATGDLCMCAVSANPSGNPTYAWHMVTTGATGVASSSLRLDGSVGAPTYVPSTVFSKLSPAGGDSVPVTDGSLALSAGDLVFCSLVGIGYGMHIVTTGATGASSSSLRLDDSPSPPAYVAGSRLTRIVPTATAAVTDNAMTINAGDMVFCRVIGNPASSNANPVYGWHMVTTGATGVSSSSLRLDNATAAPTFATGSRFSKKSASASGTDTDNAALLNTGDFALASPSKNPAASGYGWHMITTGATGVANSALRIDTSTSDTIWADCVQFEQSPVATTYCDSLQGKGTGYSGAIGSTSSRTAGNMSFAMSGTSLASGSIGFWMYPLWNANDATEHVIFDLAMADEQDRIRLVKDANNNLVLTVYDTNGGLYELTSNSPASFSRETWQHFVATFNAGTLTLYLNGVAVSTSSGGSGSGQITNTASQLYLGTDYKGNVSQGAVFDDFFVSTAVMTADAVSKIANDTGPYLGLAAARKGFNIGHGNATSAVSAGTQIGVPHGLGVTPAFVEITERNNGIVYLSASSDATNFYVKASANSVNFDWRAYA